MYAPSPFPLFEDMLADLPSVASQIIHLDFYEVGNLPITLQINYTYDEYFDDNLVDGE